MNESTENIKDLILRFLKKEVTDQEISELRHWLQKNPDNLRYFDNVNKEYQEQNVLRQLNAKRIDNAWQNLSEKTGQDKHPRNVKTREIGNTQFYFLRIAASILLLALTLAGIWQFTRETVQEINKNNIVFNPGGRSTHILLPDSTSVWLNTNSSIEYAEDFASSREVKLKGEAFFNVKKKQSQNFIVRTAQISIEVKGTRFNVQAYESQDENTTLEEGQIELTIKGDDKAYSMLPGDQITIKKSRQKIVLKKVDPSDFSAWKEERLVFDNVLLKEIVGKLENRYKVNIVIPDSIALRERLSMTIEQEPIEEILEMIQLSSNLSYRKENHDIIIYE